MGGPLKSPKRPENEFTQGHHLLLCSRVSRYNFKHQGRKKVGNNYSKSSINPSFEPFGALNDLFFDNFWSKSGQFKNEKKQKMSTSTILTIFQLKE